MSATNDQVIGITTRRRPMFVQMQPGVIARQRRTADPALVLRWMTCLLNDVYFVLGVLREHDSSQLGTVTLRCAKEQAASGEEPPR